MHRNRPWGPRLKPFTAASVLALLLAGCAVGPEYPAPDIELPDAAVADIFTVNIETEAVTNLTKDDVANYGPTYAPDGKYVVNFEGFGQDCQRQSNTFRGTLQGNSLTFRFSGGQNTFTLSK